MVRITLPPLVGLNVANGCLRTLEGVEGNVVVVDFHEISSMSNDFPELLIRRLLLRRGAREIRMIRVWRDAADAVLAAAERLGVGDRVRLGTIEDALI
jgi:hypothetical protein